MDKIRKRPLPKKWPEPLHYGDDVKPIGRSRSSDGRVWWVYDARRGIGEDCRFLAIGRKMEEKEECIISQVNDIIKEARSYLDGRKMPSDDGAVIFLLALNIVAMKSEIERMAQDKIDDLRKNADEIQRKLTRLDK